MNDLSTLSKNDLELLLKDLKQYRALERKLGKRAKSLLSESTHSIRVELAPGADQGAVVNVLKQLEVSDTSVTYTTNSRLTGGARIFIGDDLIALSFDDIIQKI